MGTLRDEALKFVHLLQDVYLKKRDIEGLLAIMDPEVTWMGTGGMLPRHGRAEAGADLAEELREYPNPFVVSEPQLDTVPVSKDACLVSGWLWVRPAGEPDGADLRFRFTLICARREGAMRLIHLHASAPDRDRLWSEHRARERNLRDQNSLRRRIDRVRRQLVERSQKLEDLMEHIYGGMYRCRTDSSLTLLDVSPSFLKLCRYTRAELFSRFQGRLIDLILPQDRDQVLRKLYQAQICGEGMELEYRLRCGDGQAIWLLSRGTVHTDPEGLGSVSCVALDVTHRKRMEEDLRLSLERHRIIVDQSTDVIFEWDMVTDRLVYSSNWKKKFGYTPVADRLSQQLLSSPRVHTEDREALMSMLSSLSSGAHYSELEMRLLGRAGRYFWCRIRATVQKDDAGTPIKAVGIIADIDAEKRQRQQLMEQASRDALTGLLNRSTLQPRVEAHLSESVGPHALMIVDLDGFKSINDCFGHMCGDSVLSDAATALQRVFRSGDILGRIGGDEFLVFLPNVGSRESAVRKANDLLSAVSGILVNGTARLSCSVGVAMAPSDANDYPTLFQLADQALYQVKKAGKGSFAFFHSDTQSAQPHLPAQSAAVTASDPGSATLDQILSQCASHLLRTSFDLHTSIRTMLEVAGRVCDVSRAYIFENSPDGRSCRNTFEWCAEGVPPQIDNLQNCVYEEMVDYQRNFDANGIFCCRDIRELPPENYRDLAPQGIVSMLRCAIREEGKMLGFVGFDECRTTRAWSEEQVHALSLAASLLASQLMKERLKERLAAVERELARLQGAPIPQV